MCLCNTIKENHFEIEGKGVSFPNKSKCVTVVVLPASGTEPMYWSSFMTSSMQLAKECLSQKLTDDMGETFQPFEGLEKFAETIETGKLHLCSFSAFSKLALL